MAIPGPGVSISMTTIATEFGGTTPHSLNEYYNGGGAVPTSPANSSIPSSGTIQMDDFYNSSAAPTGINIPIASPALNYDAYANRGPTYSPGTSITFTIEPGVTIGSSSTSTAAFSVPNSFSPTDTVTIVNNGTIQGAGGNGGRGASLSTVYPAPGSSVPASPTAGSTGGTAILLSRPTSIDNLGNIYGGGGGGGGGGARYYEPPGPSGTATAGGGGGGGSGTNGGSGGTGGTCLPVSPRRLPQPPGSSGTSSTGGTGGAPGVSYGGGAGGGLGSNGGNTGPVPYAPSAGSVPTPRIFVIQGSPGGTAGNYINGNSYATWTTTGTRLGNVV